MKKAIIFSALITAFAAQAAANAAVVPTYDANVLTIEVKTDLQDGENAAVSVIPKGAEQIVQNVYAMDDKLVSKGGILTFKFEMPEERNGSADGEYVIYIDGTEYDTFSFAAKGTRNAFCQMLKNAVSDSEIINSIDANSGYKLAALSLGLDEILWNALSETEKSQAAAAFVLSEKQEDVSRQFFTYIGAKALAAAKADAETVLNMVNPKYKDTAYKSITDSNLKSFADTYINTVVPAAENFLTEYERANVLYLLNNAKFNEMDGLITDNASLLGLSGKTEYIAYSKMSGDDRAAVCDDIIRSLAKNKISSAAEFGALLSSCINKSSGSGNGSGGSGGGGGNSSGGSKGTNIVINDPQIKEDDFVFGDVKEHWSKTAVMYLYNKGIVSGTDKNEFEPSRNVTREEFLTMLIKAKGIEAKDEKTSFTDTLEGAWYNPFVNAAVANGIAFGIDENSFGIGLPITRQDMFCMVARILEADNSVVNTGEVSDIDEVSDYAKEAVKTLYRRGIISGTGDGKSEPKKNTTRAEAAALIYKLLSR